MSGYYDALLQRSDPVHAAGWQRRLGQAARFEAALAVVEPGDRVLDVGCGPGGLAGYLAERGPDVHYHGVDVLPEMVLRARAAWPAATFSIADALDHPLPAADVAILSGTLVSGAPLTSDGARLRRFRRLVTAAWGAAARAVVVVALDQDAVEARPVLAADPALGGVRHAEASWVAQQLGATLVTAAILQSEAVHFFLRPSVVEQPSVDLPRAALTGPWGRGATALEVAWLWYAFGRHEEARAALDDGTAADSAERRWLVQALATVDG